MIRRPRRTTRTYTRVPYPPLSRPRAGGAPALGRLERLASLSASDIEQRRVAWLARAYLSERTCHGPQREQVLARLDALDLSLQQAQPEGRSEEHTSELQSIMRSSYAVFCLTKKKDNRHKNQH